MATRWLKALTPVEKSVHSSIFLRPIRATHRRYGRSDSVNDDVCVDVKWMYPSVFGRSYVGHRRMGVCHDWNHPFDMPADVPLQVCVNGCSENQIWPTFIC